MEGDKEETARTHAQAQRALEAMGENNAGGVEAYHPYAEVLSDKSILQAQQGPS